MAIALFGVGVVVLGYLADIRILYKKLEAVQRYNLAIKEQVQVAQAKLKLLRTPVMANKSQRAVPVVAELETINILGVLEQEIIAARVTPLLFEPKAVQHNANFAMFPVVLELSGTYKNLLIFIDKVMHLPYLVGVEELNLYKKKYGEAEDLQMQIFLTIYKNKSGLASDIKQWSIALTARDIFQQAIIKKNLSLWAKKELRFLGLIREADEVWGVLGDPLGGVHRVKIGDRVGLEASIVTAIGESSITTDKDKSYILQQ